jgi:putative acetyltransferase
VIVRAETADDHDDIRRINDEAFGETVESRLIDMIRASDRFVPELSLVAVSRGQSLGHVISSYVDLISVPGRRQVLQVGPLAVLPAHQRRGIGAALMEETIRIAEARGEPLLLIEGNPAYYGRFGFTRADEHGIEMPPESHGPQYFMVKPLDAYDPSLRGRAVYPPETFGGLQQEHPA